jgi:hypothetical protein
MIMKLSYNVTGQERKSLVGAISSALNAPTKYLGMPTAAYEVGEYAIDKQGTVTGPDSLDLEETLRQAGFEANCNTSEYDAPISDAEYEARQQNPNAKNAKRKGILDALVETLNENAEDGEHWERLYHEPTIIDERGREHSLDGRFASLANYETADASDRLTVEMPLDGFTLEKLDNLTKMVQAKEPLIKKALGVDALPIQMTEDNIAFPWFLPCDGNDYLAYAQFVSRLCKTAKTKKRVTAKANEDNSNPKFSFRVWLISLGMVGDEYKNARRLLLRNLEGNSSFKSADGAARWNEKHNAKKTEVAVNE